MTRSCLIVVPAAVADTARTLLSRDALGDTGFDFNFRSPCTTAVGGTGVPTHYAMHTVIEPDKYDAVKAALALVLGAMLVGEDRVGGKVLDVGGPAKVGHDAVGKEKTMDQKFTEVVGVVRMSVVIVQ